MIETIFEHNLEPEMIGDTPRRIRLPFGSSILLSTACLLFVLFIWVGTCTFVVAGKLIWLEIAGRPIKAIIMSVTQLPPSTYKSESATYKSESAAQIQLDYAYTVPINGKQLVGTGSVYIGSPDSEGARSDFRSPVYRRGDTFPLRSAPWFGSRLVSPWQSSPWGKIIFLVLCSGLVVGVSGVILVRVYRWHSLRLRLLRHGTATVGTIIFKRAVTEDNPHYFVRYGYAVGAMSRECEERVSTEQWRRFEVGQPVTVLYDPKQTSAAGLYALIVKP